MIALKKVNKFMSESNAKDVEQVIIGSHVELLEEGLFENMTKLKVVDFSNARKDLVIPASCFKDCTNIEKIKIDKLEDVKHDTFSNCESLVEVDCGSISCVHESAFYNCCSLETVSSFSTNLTAIGQYAFYNNKSILNLQFLDHLDDTYVLSKVGKYAFAKSGLKNANLVLKSSVTDTYWGSHCFEDCKDLESVTFLKSMYQSHYMFKGCTNLKTVNFPDGQAANYVGKYVFDDCSSLENVTFTDSLYSFLEGYFNNCTNLKSVNFNKYEDCKFKCISKYAFNNCKSLTSLEFPESLDAIEKIEDTALSGCVNLNNITFHGISRDSIITSGLEDDLYLGKKIDIYTTDLFDAVFDLAEERKIPFLITYIPSYTVLNSDYSRTEYASTVRKLDEAIELLDPISESANDLSILIINVKRVIETDLRSFPNSDEDLYRLSCFLHDDLLEFRKTFNRVNDYGNDFVKDDLFVYISYRLLNSLSAVKSSFAKKFKPQVLAKYDDTNAIKYSSMNYIHFGSFDYSADNVEFYYQNRKKQETILLNTSEYKKNLNLTLDKLDLHNDNPKTFSATIIDKKLRKECISNNLIQSLLTLVMPQNLELQENGFFRLNHDCNVVLLDDSIFYYHFIPSLVKLYSEPYHYPSDKTTRDNFKIASEFKYKSGELKSVWYYNAKEIKLYAEKNNIPLLIIHSFESCTPCLQYLKYIHDSSEFQDWAKKLNFLLCRLEAEETKDDDEEIRYCLEDLRDLALNYDPNGKGEVELYNAFGNTTSSKKVIAGQYGPYTYMPPAMTFFYKRSNTVVSNFIYSFHEFFNNLYAYEKATPENFMQMIKSLCLYHFDNNKLSDAEFVVDANKKFVKVDYEIEIINRFLIEDNIIQPSKVYPELTTLDKVKSYIRSCQIKAGHNIDSGEYLGGCYFDVVDWIYETYDTSNLCLTKDESGNVNLTIPNQELDKWYIKIGDKFYKMQLSNTSKYAGDTCSENDDYVYLVLWNEVEIKYEIEEFNEESLPATFNTVYYSKLLEILSSTFISYRDGYTFDYFPWWYEISSDKVYNLDNWRLI